MLKTIARSIAIAAAATTFSKSSFSADDIPATWDDFKRSKNKNDIAVVSKILKDEWWNTCAKYGRLRRAGKETREFSAYREHLIAEDMLNGADLMNIEKRRVAVGMSVCGAFAAIGTPTRANRTTTAHGTRQQLVYETPRRYVYIEDDRSSRTGIVVAIQD